MTYQTEVHRLNLQASQYALLDELVASCCRLYNAALEERIGNWKFGRQMAVRRDVASPRDLPKNPTDPREAWSPVTLHSQFAALTRIRGDDPTGYGALPTNMAREVLVRLDEAFKRFFARAKAAHGRMFDARTILDQAAEIAGHADPSTLKPYLTAAMKKDVFRRGEVVHVANADDAEVLRKISEALTDTDPANAAAVRRMLDMLAERAIEIR